MIALDATLMRGLARTRVQRVGEFRFAASDYFLLASGDFFAACSNPRESSKLRI